MSEIKSQPEVKQQQIFAEVLQRLTRAGVSPEIIKQLDEAMDFAVHHLKLAIDFSVLGDQPTSVQERLLLLAAIAHRWKEQGTPNAKKKELAILMTHLFLPTERNTSAYWERIGESEDESLQSLETSRYNDIAIHYAYLHMSLAPNTIETEMTKFLAESPAVQKAKLIKIYTLAREKGYARELKEQGRIIWEINLNLQRGDVKRLGDIFRQHGYAFIIANAMNSKAYENVDVIMYSSKNPTQARREHELNHVRYPGLETDFFGNGINEAVTEYLAQETVKKRNDRFTLRRLLGRAPTAPTREALTERMAYREEIGALLALCDHNPSLMESIVARYKRENRDTSANMMAGLLNTLGVDGLLDLYRMSPKKNSTMSLLTAQEFRQAYFP